MQGIDSEGSCKDKHTDKLFLEKGYGDILGYSNAEYEAYGAKFAAREQALDCDVVCDPKIGDAGYLCRLKEQALFCWVHLAQNRIRFWLEG